MTNRIGLPGNLYTIPVEPDAGGYKVTEQSLGQSQRALTGALHTTFAAMKRRWAVSWSGLAAAQREVLLMELRRLAHLTWEPPEGASYTVKVASAGWSETPNAVDAYTVTSELEEV